ncbi:putative splicing factor 3A subunit 1 [Heracleum sosnowskyi]|uniref:Splicing factor 3A subunit 1 n=1 Tax=Heracleum sosnowskyi TaxID=360622 RepID=A0AAD8IZK0_9APIA|nr:putative splicing factor 3A subunit 1 [Heracleum sosnowskyi]
MAMLCLAPASVATHTNTIGIIHPPPDIRNIIDKAASYVAKNGQDFQCQIINGCAQKLKVSFLKASDPYHAYYQHRLFEYQAKPDPSEQFRTIRKPLVPPEAEQYTIRFPEGIMCEELDVIKLTAQFVARNGNSFLSEVANRERNNPQFQFMKPTNSLFMFFTMLTGAYSKVLMPPKGLSNKLKNSVDSMTAILERCHCRLEWESSQEQAKQKAEDEMEQERLQMAMIDWHHFSGVVDIDFADNEDDKLPPPMTLEEVIRRSKMSTLKEDIFEPGKEVQMEMDKEEVHVEEGMRIASPAENGDDKPSEPKLTPMEQDPPMRIVKNYRRPEERILAERDSTEYVVSPITGELILKIEMAEHIRISLIDPKYKEQKERMFAKIRDSTLAQDDEIFKNIMGLARTRPDIFGTTEEEVSSAVKAEIERKKDEKQKQDMSQNSNGEDINYVRTLTGPAPLPRPCKQLIRLFPLAVNLSRPLNTVWNSTPTSSGVAPPPPVQCVPVRPPPPSMQMNYTQQPLMANPPPPMHPSISANPSSNLLPPKPGSQGMSLRAPQPYAPHLMPQHEMHMVPLPPMFQAIYPPPPPEEDLPLLLKEPEPKRQRLDDSLLIPEDQFLAQYQGPTHINVSVPNIDGANLRGQVLEITVQSLSETISTLKEKIAGEIQLPSNKQKLSGKAGFLKDNLSLAYYNVAGGGTLSLSLRERGGRKRKDSS